MPQQPSKKKRVRGSQGDGGKKKQSELPPAPQQRSSRKWLAAMGGVIVVAAGAYFASPYIAPLLPQWAVAPWLSNQADNKAGPIMSNEEAEVTAAAIIQELLRRAPLGSANSTDETTNAEVILTRFAQVTDPQLRPAAQALADLETDKAIELLANFIAKHDAATPQADPALAHAQVGLAVLLNWDQPARACELLAAVTKRTPQHLVAQQQLGLLAMRLGRMPDAVAAFQQTVQIARENKDSLVEESSLGNLGIAYARAGQVDKAIACHQQALEIARQSGDRQSEGRDLGNLGAAYYRIGDMPKAIEAYQQALTIAREIGDHQGEGNRLGNIGLAYAESGQSAQAIVSYQQSVRILDELASPNASMVHAWLDKEQEKMRTQPSLAAPAKPGTAQKKASAKPSAHAAKTPAAQTNAN